MSKAGLDNSIERNSVRCYDPLNATVTCAFAQVVSAYADNVAIVEAGRPVTFADLDRSSRTLAGLLISRGVTPHARVGILAGRSTASLIAMLAVLRCGAAFVPLDPDYPGDTLEFMLADSAPALLLHRGALASDLRLPERVGALDIEAALAAGADLPTSLDVVVAPSSPAYVMYTSGSTGRPKGVVVPHRAIVRLVRDQNYMDFAVQQRFLHHSPPSFDASTWEIWGPLLNGNAVVVHASPRIALSDISQAIMREGVTSLWLTAGLFHAFANHDIAMLRGLRTLIVGGDVVDPRAARHAIDNLDGCQLVNGYGPTEATTFSCCYRMPRDLPADRPIPIGRAIAHSDAFVADGAAIPGAAEPGETGELLITGDGLALGYLERPELSAERFVTATLHGREVRAYRTGDLARFRADGEIEFLGRMDRQVKVNGKRIELDEIEHALRRSPALTDAVAVLDQDAAGRKRIVAFVLAVEPVGNVRGPALRDDVLAEYRSRMPEHLVPNELHVVSVYPLNANGKVDRKALLEQTRRAASTADQPRAVGLSPVEKTIAGLWCDALGHTNFELTQNFFDCGGTSLAMVEIHARLQSALGRQIPVTELFAHPTVAGLAKALGDPAEAAPKAVNAALARAGQQKAALARLRGGRVGPPVTGS